MIVEDKKRCLDRNPRPVVEIHFRCIYEALHAGKHRDALGGEWG